ncbi:hypothetical protein BCR44DRAFT_23777 [Catenaria anguillulae PL171]|uniref:Uncharacterized protein n=1 Tax=Catenaria anguillulae PL171 TaxID=765915 RepID=A0A1Y2HWM1_9FUNG|nr:hypothetical protein BCR44DRAFT_23777 [Catenaria anguillulae PL171]
MSSDTATPTPANLAALLACFRARRDAALARRHDELAVFWAQQAVALVRTLDPPALANESYTLATAILHLGQPLRASSIVYPFIATSLACRVLYAHANLLAGCTDDDLIGELTDPDTYQELTLVVDPVPVLPGEVDRVARILTLRGGWHIRRMEMMAAKQCLVGAVDRDSGAWDAIRALIEYKLLTPDEERKLVDVTMQGGGFDESSMWMVGLGNESSSATSTGSRSTRRGASAAATETNKRTVWHAMQCLLHAHVAGTAPGTLSPSPTLYLPTFNQAITHLDTMFKLGYSPTTHLALGTAQLDSSSASSSSNAPNAASAAALATFDTLARHLDPHSATTFIAHIDTHLARGDVRALHAAATASTANDPTAAPLDLLMYSEDKYKHHAETVNGALHALLASTAATSSALATTNALPGTLTVHVHVLACYAIAAYHVASAHAATNVYAPPVHALDTVAAPIATARASPWTAYMPALRALDAAFALDEAFAPGIVLYANVCSDLALALVAARAGVPMDDPTDLATLSDLMDAVDKARAVVPNALEPVWALARMSRALGDVPVARRYYQEVEDRLRAQGRHGGVEEARIKGEVGGLLAENHQLSEGLQMLQDAVTRLRGKVHARVRVPLITSLVQAIVSMVSQFDDTTTVAATTELSKAHVHLLDAIAATPPVHRFHLYALQARICDLLRDARGALVAYQAALALKPGDPEMTKKMHMAAALNVDLVAERVSKRVRQAEQQQQRELGRVDGEVDGEEDELIPPSASRLVTSHVPATRRWLDVQDVEMQDHGDDDDEMDQDDFVTQVPGKFEESPAARALAAGKHLDVVAAESRRSRVPWVLLDDHSSSSSCSSSTARTEQAKFTAAELDEPTQVLPLMPPPGGTRQRPTRSTIASPPPVALPSDRRNLTSLFERAADRRTDSTATMTGAYPTDSAVGGVTDRLRTRPRQLVRDVAEEDSEAATDPDSSIDHNSPTVRLAAAAAGTGGPTTRAAARRAQGQGQGQRQASVDADDSQVVASPTVAARGARRGGGAGRGGAAGGARNARNGR